MASPIISIIDSYYQWISQQMLTLGATVYVRGQTIPQPMCPVVEARDWPATPNVEGGLYLLILNDTHDGNSQAQKNVTIFCQWMWLLMGTDIQPGQLAANRGDRYRSNRQIIENLRQANYPGYCRKYDYTTDGAGNITPVPSTSQFPPSPVETVTWSALKFPQHNDNNVSGLLYGMATVELQGFSDVSLLVA